MAIEAIGSLMSAQIQTTQSSQASAKPAVEYTEVSSADPTAYVDNATITVAKSETKDDSYQNNSQHNNEQIKKAVEKINKKIGNSEVVFGIHEGTNRVTIKIVDKETKEVIKELPPEKTLDMIAKAWELAGLLVDEKR